MTGVNWAELLHVAANKLFIPPEMFWKLSIWEWQQMVGTHSDLHADRQILDQLTKQYPDECQKEDRHEFK